MAVTSKYPPLPLCFAVKSYLEEVTDSLVKMQG